ncbi:MAG: EipB family protein [Alphaproteobacteria bacterium]
MRRRISRLFFLAAVVVAGAAAAATKVEIAPHRAIFQVSLAEPSTVMAAARGLAAIELGRTCDGWRYRQRYELETIPVSGERSRMAFTVDGRESLDGLTYAFRSGSDYGDGDPLQLIGRAELSGTGGVVRYTEPVATEKKLPKGTGFVVGAMQVAIQAALDGKKNVSAPWFTGSTPEEPLIVSSLIVPLTAKVEGQPLLQGKRWRFLSAFFTDPDQSTPDYEGEETLLENGVLAEATYRYDGYALKLELQRLEPLPLPDC